MLTNGSEDNERDDGEGFPDNLLWHLDRADSLTGKLDSSSTRTLTGKGAVVYMFDTGVMSTHDELMRADGSVVIGAIQSDAKIVAVWGDGAGTNIDRWIGTFDAIIKHAWDPATPPFKTTMINMSFVPSLASANDPKFPLFEKKLREMIGGVDANGNPDPNGKRFLFTTIAGNTGPGGQCDADGNSNLYPGILGSSIDGLITVGGIDETNHLWAGSCKGPAVDILAPAASTSSHVANADETTAGGRVAGFDLISRLPRGRVVHH